MSFPGQVNSLQTLLDGTHPSLFKPLPTKTIKDTDIAKSDILTVFDHAKPLGISPGYLPGGELVSLAISDDSNCRIVEFQELTEKDFTKRGKEKPKPLPLAKLHGRKLLQEKILCRPVGDIFAFDMGPLAMALHISVGLRVTNAVDIQSAFPETDRKPLDILREAFKETSEGVKKIHEDNVQRLFETLVYNASDNVRNRITDNAQRAWVAQFLGGFGGGEQTFAKVKRIDTLKLPAEDLVMIAKIASDSHRLDSKKSLQMTHRFKQMADPTQKGVILENQDYNNKIRCTPDKKISMKIKSSNGGYYTVNGAVSEASGKLVAINTGSVDRKLNDKDIVEVTSYGRDGPTTAESQRAALVLRILQGKESLRDDSSPWTQNIWLPNPDGGPLVWPAEWAQQAIADRPHRRQISAALLKYVPTHQLNASQQAAVNTMLSEADDHRITIIQGPPGTGKTSVIASFVHFTVDCYDKKGIWLVAYTNVAVKNIAEKLISTGFTKWKILISKDFHFAWHEHLYTDDIQEHIIRSDQFFKYKGPGDNRLKDIRVFICTLSMLSNPLISKFTAHNPVRTLVIDEASQIEIGNYLTVFNKFKSTLRKTCFIGDPKQLPPHGQEDLGDLQSIFEVAHLHKQIIFLDTQYRMPPQIGRIISKYVYDGQLKSNESHPITDDITACYFIDVSAGKEEKLTSGSYINTTECSAVYKLAFKLQSQGKRFKIITPYDAQTSHIEKALNEGGLDWEDKCFNVDSFQGNEEDYIIVSIVRTLSPGFLTNLRRTNVMLSRCKKGMFIVANPQFLKGKGDKTLVGDFLNELEPVKWLTAKDVEQGL